MKIQIRDTNQALIDEFQKLELPENVEAHCMDMFGWRSYWIVSPANCFGDMGGGIDAVYLKRWPNFQERAQHVIRGHGGVKVGDSFVMNTGEHKFPYVIVAPTMRIPRPIVHHEDVYFATLSALQMAARMLQQYPVNFEPIFSIPGMGTLSGRVPLDVAAGYMVEAMRDYKLEPDELYDKTRRMFMGY